ncbi:exocyst complex component SEC5A-like isoform X3 [Cynara cardunculus var. scolymus]|uniref:exocyst complex component SEC5A-like isoform X3 n=1 Tax=Cynara cardunculus var. scolymus TaxID=59895 RepID=UPI000D629F5B|nr:exocyst complex component SEC5A-like isoform X3 [Cynara cardunculus var. scolymus]
MTKRYRIPEEEDDDDSEVEMLSISSEDEDSGIAQKAGAKKGSGTSGGGGKDDDTLWEGGEPTKWKQVNESELARRVREMRESKAAPVPQKLERKQTAAAKGLNNLQSLPRGMECIDPLGLGIIDNRTLRLIDERSLSSPSKSEKVDSDLRERLMFFSERFDPKLFITRIHQFTAAADLEAGALALKTDLIGRTQQRKQLVKENFDCFVSCKTTIDDIESKLQMIEDDPEGCGTAHLNTCIQGVNSLANRAFEPLLERQAQAEKIRAVQGVLQRFRTLFNLPSAIRGNISKGEYDLAVREYRKAKSIVLPSHGGMLKRVLEEVEKVIHEFKGMLYQSMEDPQIDLTNLENVVRLLLELEPESDPVRRYFSIQNRRIRCLLEKCTSDHESRMETLQNKLHEKALSDEKWKKIQQDLHESVSNADVDCSLRYPSNLFVDTQTSDSGSDELDALRGRYIRRLTAVLIHHIPSFWKVALSVSSGKFAKVSEQNISTPANMTEEKAGHPLEVASGMIHNTISAYESKVQNSFHDLEESNVLFPYMSDAIMDISKACQAFEAKEAAPTIAVEALRALLFGSTKIYILRLCSWMRTSIEEISKHESWVPVTVLERNKSPYAISFLPLAFRSVMVSAMDQIDMMMKYLRSEATSEDTLMLLQEAQESVRLSFFNCLLGFAGHMEDIGGELGQNISNPPFQNGYPPVVEENSLHHRPGCITDPHQKLLMVLSNIGFAKDDLFHEMYNKYKHVWLQARGREDDDDDREELVVSFSVLEEKVLSKYTFAKANYVRTAATNYLLDAGLQWGGAPAVKGVRDPAVELMHTLVVVHAEVFAGCEPLLDKTLGIVVEGLIDTLLSLFHEHKDTGLKLLDANGYCQLMLEVEYFETILNQYFTGDATESLKSLQGVLLEKATESNCSAEPSGDDAAADEKQTASPDDLIALAQQCSSELLQSELERTRINTACFMESFPLEFAPESVKVAYASFRGSMDASSGAFMAQAAVGSRQRWR